MRASSEILSSAESPHLTWCTADTEADYRRLKPGEFFNHFRQNCALTTKVGLHQSLAEHSAATGANIDSFFPRCYVVTKGGERDDFVLDFRRSAALKVALMHLQLDAAAQDSCSRPGTAAYSCNFDVLGAAEAALLRWCKDLDPEHLDEEQDEERECRGTASATAAAALEEDAWDAVVLYSELTQSQICTGEAVIDGEAELMRHPRRRYHRIGGGDIEEEGRGRAKHPTGEVVAPRPLELRKWPEFRSHSWGPAPPERRAALEELLGRLEGLFPQWALQGGWVGRNVWIIKPGTNSKGSGIECMNTLPELLHHCDTMPNRIVQKYIERPLTLFSGRKFDIRQWVLVRSVSPLRVFLFSECYLRLCNGMYDLGDLRDRERHISNWQVNKHGRNIVEGAAASLPDFREELREMTGRESYWEEELEPQMRDIVIKTLRAAAPHLTPRDDSFELYGFDVMVDEGMRLWLLEVNLSPGCEGRTPFLERLLERMSRRLVEVAVLGREEPDGEQPDWVKICDDAADGGSSVLAAAEAARRQAPERPRPGANLTVRGRQIQAPPGRRKDAPRRPVPGRLDRRRGGAKEAEAGAAEVAQVKAESVEAEVEAKFEADFEEDSEVDSEAGAEEEAKAEAEAEAEAEVEAEVELEVEVEAEVESEVEEMESKAGVEAEAEEEAEVWAEADAEAVADSEDEIDAEEMELKEEVPIEAEAKAKAQLEPEAGPEADVEAKVGVEAEAEEGEAEAMGKVEVQAQAEAQTETQVEREVGPNSDVEAKVGAEAEAEDVEVDAIAEAEAQAEAAVEADADVDIEVEAEGGAAAEAEVETVAVAPAKEPSQQPVAFSRPAPISCPPPQAAADPSTPGGKKTPEAQTPEECSTTTAASGREEGPHSFEGANPPESHRPSLERLRSKSERSLPSDAEETGENPGDVASIHEECSDGGFHSESEAAGEDEEEEEAEYTFGHEEASEASDREEAPPLGSLSGAEDDAEEEDLASGTFEAETMSVALGESSKGALGEESFEVASSQG